MKPKLLVMSAGLFAILTNPDAGVVHGRFNNRTDLPTKVLISCSHKISGGEKGECKVGVDSGHEDKIRIKIVTTNPALVQLGAGEVELAPKQEYVKVPITSSATPIKTTVVIKGSLSGNSLINADESIDVVPALIASVNLAGSSFIGTKGAKVTCQVKLRAPAPTGGIEIYLSPLSVAPRPNSQITLDLQNPRVPAGKDFVDLNIAYSDLRAAGGQRIDEFYRSGGSYSGGTSGPTDFNLQTRTAELVVALEPQTSLPWQPITGLAHRVSFQVVPLRVSSLVSQPATLIGGAEALASITLSASPGNSEVAYLAPIHSSSAKLWPVLLGSSCAAQAGTTTATSTATYTTYDAIELVLIPGTTTYSFKVCTAPVSAAVSDKVRVFLRSGSFDTTVNIQSH